MSDEKEHIIDTHYNLNISPENDADGEKANPGRLRAIRFYVSNILEMTIFEKWRADKQEPGGKVVGMAVVRGLPGSQWRCRCCFLSVSLSKS